MDYHHKILATGISLAEESIEHSLRCIDDCRELVQNSQKVSTGDFRSVVLFVSFKVLYFGSFAKNFAKNLSCILLYQLINLWLSMPSIYVKYLHKNWKQVQAFNMILFHGSLSVELLLLA